MDEFKPTVASNESASVPWSPRQLVFRPYAPVINTGARTQNLRVFVKRPVSEF